MGRRMNCNNAATLGELGDPGFPKASAWASQPSYSSRSFIARHHELPESARRED
ncbi:hypothetical protein I552_6976 [Mycobacterium xenopi 3993]|nr:hypothetical protein I552_6976 [Mycobacterium xenopi 3993]